ncbi:MAG TPA: dihydroorotate dehydrogenase electron transfer subunit [Thermoanaerobaculia bacterium]|nr:dihydroorotate dehydrogenase electron transfer subunit [Thermoanaerobaculia bacterium]
MEAVEPRPLPYYTLRLRVPDDYRSVAPGQFVMVQAGTGIEPYLRRAFSVFDVSEGEAGLGIELLGKVIGRGTRRLADCRPGDSLPLLGPLGRGFALPAGGAPVLVAGGVGSAALLLLARALAARGVAFDVYYGGRSAVDLACGDRFRRLAESSGGRYVTTTEDGTAGEHGLITTPLERALAAGCHDALFTCGPHGLMRRVAQLGEAYGVPGQAALETAMGCGYGACLGCAVTRCDGRYALCCKDGPVFDLGEVTW